MKKFIACAEDVGVKGVELLPNGMTKVDLGNDQRKRYLFQKGVLDDLARRCLERAEAPTDQPSTGDL